MHRRPLRGRRVARLTVWLALALAFAAPAQANEAFDTLTRSAFFSDPCRQEAAALGIPPGLDADALFAAFTRRPKASSVEPQTSACASPETLLINLFRSNGIEAELALVGHPTSSSPTPARRMLVYVPSLDRYVDATGAKPSIPDRAAIARVDRVHFAGPTLDPKARDRCVSVCMRSYTVGGTSTMPVASGVLDPASAVRGKTETIPGR